MTRWQVEAISQDKPAGNQIKMGHGTSRLESMVNPSKRDFSLSIADEIAQCIWSEENC